MVARRFKHRDQPTRRSAACGRPFLPRCVLAECCAFRAKLYASEVAVRCANEGVQIHGGYGFIKDYPAEKFYRDVKLCTIGEGTSEIQRLVIARQLLKD